MAKSNEKFRSNLAKEMRDKYNERNKKLEQVEGSSFSDGLKEQMKKEIVDNFNQEMEEMKTRPGYEEARKTHLEEVKAKIKLTKSKKEKKRLQKGYEDMKERLRREYEKKLEEAKADVENSQEEYEDMEERLRREYEKKLREYEKKLEEAEADMENSQVEYEDVQIAHEDAQIAHKYVQTAHGGEAEYEKMFGNEKAILKNLKEHYVRKDEAEVMGYKGKIVHVNLPAVGNFEGFNFDYFVSYAHVHKDDFEANPEFEKKSYSMKKICDILKAMNRYLAELGVKTDGNKNYENDLQGWNWKSLRGWIVYYFPTDSKAGDGLKDVTGLNRAYWTSDKKVYRREDSCIRLDCSYDSGPYFRDDDETVSHCLFLRLYD